MSAFEPKIAIDGSAPYSNANNDDSPTPADFANQPKEGKTWKILKMKHEHYEERALDVCKQDLLFEGGFQMNHPDIAKLFCPKMKTEEDDSTYNERVASAAYIPTFSKLITGLVSNLFSQDLSVMEAADHDDPTTAGDEFTENLRDYYKLFQQDVDGHGTTLHNFIRNATTKALIHSFCYFGVDYPKGEATNRLEQELLGLDRPKLYKIDSESVFDWTMMEDSNHEFQEIKLVSCEKFQPSLFDPLMHKYLVKRWFINEEGFASYECFESPPFSAAKPPKDKDVFRRVDEGTTSFKRIPIFLFCLDDGIAVGKKLAPLAAEHFNRTTIENHSTNKACLTIPVLYRGNMFPGGDMLPDPSAMNSQRGTHPRGKVNSKGVVELGSFTEDRLEIVEAEGKALAFIHKQNEDLDEKMHSVVHQMAQSLKQARSSSGKTAASKQEDRRSTEMLLTAIADEIFSITEQLFSTISESRGEDIIWDVRGLSSSAQDDREELVKEAGLMNSLNLPSITAKKEYAYRIISRLVEGTDQRTLQTIRAEIQEQMDTVHPMQSVNDAADVVQQAQITKTVPSQAPPKVNAPGGSDKPTEPNPIGPAGQALLPDGAHLQTGQHIDGQTVFDQLVEDYKESDIQWVLHIPWIGPVEVPLSAIDFSNKDNWQASEDEDKVGKFADKMANDGFSKPVILVNNPSNDNKMMVVDGHHRSLAAMQNGQPVTAYVGQVGSNKGPWDKLHSKQVGSKQASISSNQTITQQADKQVAKAETAKNGKTK